MAFTISADDPRTIRALEIAANADQWLNFGTRAGQPAYGVPSQSEPGRSYVVTCSSCDCPDFRGSTLDAAAQADARDPRACKHILAVQLYHELVRAQHQRSLERQAGSRPRAHLTVAR